MMKNSTLLFFTILIVSFNVQNGTAQFTYISPKPGSIYHNPATSIILKNGDPVDATSLKPDLFVVTGSLSGNHNVTVSLSDDQKTILVFPVTPFADGESVSVTIASGIKKQTGTTINGTNFSFQTHPHYSADQQAEIRNARKKIYEEEFGNNNITGTTSVRSHDPKLPAITITSTGKEYPQKVFYYNFKSAIPGDTTADFQYRTIIDNNGDSVFATLNNNLGIDFKINHNGYLTYYNNEDSMWEMMDTMYNVINSFGAGNGYEADNHEFQIFPDGHCFLLIYDTQIIDMSKIVSGGNPAASVTGTIIQELDKNKNVVFEWSSWDHLSITDSYISLTNSIIDLVHGNSIEQDTDGNIIASFRHYSEISKLDLNTGDFMWRLGGKNNQFTFLDDTVNRNQIYFQHDVRRRPNGDISLFNNNNGQPTPSSAKEYAVDVVNKTATLKWIFIHPEVDGKKLNSNAMGDVQLLPNGDRFICWGLIAPTTPPAPMPNFTEVDSLGNIVWELRFSGDEGYISYRGFKFPWDRCGLPLPASLTTSNITSKSADLSWAVPSFASNFELQYKEDASVDWITITTTNSTYSLNALTPETLYDWRVKTVCSVFPDSSDYSATQQFNTIASGISALPESSFNFYPNPASDLLQLNFVLQKSSEVQFSITNVVGSVIYTKQWMAKEGMNSSAIHLPAAVSGIYLVTLKTDALEYRGRLVIR